MDIKYCLYVKYTYVHMFYNSTFFGLKDKGLVIVSFSNLTAFVL